MLALLFYLGDAMYSISCNKVREIVPMMTLKTVPHGPEFFTGFFNYRGEIVPVIDLCSLISGSPCNMRLSTRIILVDYTGENDRSYLLGLVAERVTETMRIPEENFVSSGVSLESAPYLHGILMENNHMIQYIDLDFLPDCIGFLPAMKEKNK